MSLGFINTVRHVVGSLLCIRIEWLDEHVAELFEPLGTPYLLCK